MHPEEALRQALLAFHTATELCSSLPGVSIESISLETALFLEDAHANFASIFKQTADFYRSYQRYLTVLVEIPEINVPKLFDQERYLDLSMAVFKEIEAGYTSILRSLESSEQLVELLQPLLDACSLPDRTLLSPSMLCEYLLPAKLSHSRNHMLILRMVASPMPLYAKAVQTSDLAPDQFADAALKVLTIYLNTVSSAAVYLIKGVSKADVSRFMQDRLEQINALPKPFLDITARSRFFLQDIYGTPRVIDFCGALSVDETVGSLLTHAARTVDSLVGTIRGWLDDIACDRRINERRASALDIISRFVQDMLEDYVRRCADPEHWRGFVAQHFPQYYHELYERR